MSLNPAPPMALANKRFPYTELADDQRFEDLLFDLYSSEIKASKLAGFDAISRMTGTADLGKDCGLYRHGKQYGLIQGKKYRDLLSKAEFGKEIVKFCLYTLLYPELIHDADDYTYFIAVGYGFDRHCIDFMADFNQLIKTEPALDKWIAHWLKKPAFSLLGLKETRPRVLPILEKIKVRPVWPPNLDELLTQDRNKHFIPSYFEVRTITLNETPKLSPEMLRAELKVASTILGLQRNEFEGIPGSHIPRQETAALYEWIMAPVKLDAQDRDENICLLAANPGLGKTVVIRDLYDRLQAEYIPVMALKADEVFGQNLKTLGEQAGISLPLRGLIDQCKEHFPKVVLLIDQIDALSQSLSADPNFLTTYKQLIGAYTHDSTVRIVVSVRLFDLYYDPSLKVYRNVKAFELRLLDATVVLAELAKIGITPDRISPSLLELLRTPNHLDIFSRICKEPSQFSGIKTLVDLYNVLWTEKIGKAAGLAYEIAGQMYSAQRITVSESLFENQTANLLYLKKERLIKTDSQGLQFFHQTFYDYVFARRFVQQGASLAGFLDKERQSILSRSAVKMIMGQLRPHDPANYIAQLTQLLRSKKYHFHIKHLLISFFAVQDQPMIEEQQLLADLLLPNADYAQVFYDQVSGPAWIDFLLKNDYLKKISDPVTLFHLLRRNLNYSPGPMLDFMANMKDRKSYVRLLYGLADWSQPKALLLLDDIDQHTYGLMEQAAEHVPLLVFEKVKADFFRLPAQTNHQQQQRDSRLYETLFEKIPLELCNYAIETIDQEIPGKVIDGYQDKLDHDYFIGGLELSDEEHVSRMEGFYKLFAQQLKKFAAGKAPIFTEWLDIHKQSTYRSIIKLMVYCLRDNEKLYAVEIYDLLIYLHEMEVFCEHGRLKYYIRQLLKAAYPVFIAGQQESIQQMILNLRVVNEHVKYERDGKKTFSVWGATQLFFLKVLPEHLLIEDPRLKKRYQELLRRHGDVKERKPQISVLRGNSAPLTTSAYLHMSGKDWLKSFRKYDRFYDRWGHRHDPNSFGGMHEHADAFLKAVLGDPARHFPLVTKIVSDTSIDEYYALKGLEGLSKKNYQIPETIELFKTFLKRPIDKSNVIWCLNLADKLSDRGNYDKDILNYVISQALSGPEPGDTELKGYIQEPKNNIDRYVQAGIGTDRGSAAHMLVQITDKRYSDDIFNAIEGMMQKEVAPIKAAAIYQYAFLMNLDPKRAFSLFVSIVADPQNGDILTCTLWSLQYLVNYNFKKLIPHLTALIHADDLLVEDKTWLSTILFGAWLHGYRNADKLFELFLRKHASVRPHAARDAVKYFYEDGKVSKKSFRILKSVFSNKKGKGKDFYLPELDTIKLKDIYPVLKLLVKAPFFELKESFIEYLIDQTPASPLNCIRLFDAAISNHKSQPDEPEFFGHEGSATKFILGAHTALGKKYPRYQEKLLDAFDKVLSDPRFRNNADNLLEKALA